VWKCSTNPEVLAVSLSILDLKVLIVRNPYSLPKTTFIVMQIVFVVLAAFDAVVKEISKYFLLSNLFLDPKFAI
jgi:hypothetical protein